MVHSSFPSGLSTECAPEVLSFVRQAMRKLEQENVIDAPGMISGVLRDMQTADSDVIRGAAAGVESLLMTAFVRRLQRAGV